MADEFDGDFGGDYNFFDSGPSQYPETMNLPASDPASPYYTGPGSGYNQAGPLGMAGAEYSMPPGSGAYSVGGGDWQGIYAPGAQQGDYLYDANKIYGPTDYSMAAGRGPSSDPSARLLDQWNANPSLGIPSGAGYGGYNPSGRPGGGGGFTQQPFQRIGLGQPERTLYDRYSSILRNPDQLTSDPTYQFLFNQGQQALNRSLAAKRLTYSGKALNDTMAYGQGMAGDYFKRLIPEYRRGAEEELKRFLGPAGLLPHYAGVNNAASTAEGSAAAARELMPLYQQMLGGNGNPGAGIGYGGVGSGYTQAPQQRLATGWGGPTSPGGVDEGTGLDDYTFQGPVKPYYSQEDLAGLEGGPL